MKSLFGVVAALVKVNTTMQTAITESIREEGKVVPEFIADVRNGIQESGLIEAVKANIDAVEGIDEVPEWAKKSVTEWKKLGNLFKPTPKPTPIDQQ